MPVFAYLRVSTVDQTTGQQKSQIANAGYKVANDRVYAEQGVSGKVPALQRPKFKELEGRLDAGDTLVVVKLDRLGRDTLDVITTIQKLIGKGVSVAVLGLGVLDGSPQSNLTMTMLIAISSFERELISERTKAKLSQMRAEGIRLGRPRKVDDETLRARATELFGQGLSWRRVANETNIALSTLQRLMKPTASNTSAIAEKAS